MHAHASDLANDPFIRQVLDRQHFEPDGKYHLFGSRGELAERSGHIGLGNIQSHQLGNLMIQQAAIKGNIGYIVRFSDHGHEVHSPFDNHASHSDSDEAGSPVDGFSLYRIHWDGYEHHPADGYDGPQGGGYPAPKGARDIYSYDIKGVAQNIRLNLTDNRSTGQRLADRFHNAGAMLTQGVGDGFKRATRYSPELDRSGNAAEAFNGTADIVKNIIGAAGEIVGAGDAVQGISEGSNIAVMHGLGLLSTENKMARINDLADMAQLKDYAAAAIRDWAVQNPNAAQGIEAVSNIFTAVIPVKGIGAVRGKIRLGRHHGTSCQAVADGRDRIAEREIRRQRQFCRCGIRQIPVPLPFPKYPFKLGAALRQRKHHLLNRAAVKRQKCQTGRPTPPEDRRTV